MDREQADILSVAEDRDLFEPFARSTVLVTGATGLIGSMLLKTLREANLRYGLGIRLAGQIRNPDKARTLFGAAFADIAFSDRPDVPCDWIVHTVSPTTSRFFVEHPVETIRTSVGSTLDSLEAAKKRGASILYLSSMEQYGVPYGPDGRMAEGTVGIIDHLSVRASYSESKRLCECLCVSYAAEYGVDAKIARLAQTFGAGVSPSDTRMPVQFARAVVENRDIVLRTQGKSVSNFVYLADALSALLLILAKGGKGEAYNVCNDAETRTVSEIAELVAREVAHGQIRVRTELDPQAGFAPDTHLRLDSRKLVALGWKPMVGMVEAYGRLVEHLAGGEVS